MQGDHVGFTVATAKAPVPVVPGMFTMPGSGDVAARATMSGTGVEDAESSKVLVPVRVATGLVFDPAKFSATSVGPKEAVGVIAIT
jgi:hypothetical protein